MKNFLILFLLIMPPVFSKTADSKNYPINADDMYLLSISCVSKLNFKISELQSSSGYILFKTPNNDEYLLMISGGSAGSNVKIEKTGEKGSLNEIQTLIYNTLTNEINNIPKRAE